jgi:hypothetical protein
VNRRTLPSTSIPPRPALVVAVLATCACSLVSLDGLTGGFVPVGTGRDAGSDSGVDSSLPPPSAYAQVVLADDPVAYWRLDESSGATARDFSGHGNDATYIGGVQLGTPGAIANDPDTAATFDGATGYLDAGDNFAFAGTQAFSVEAWVRSLSMQGYGGIFSREDTSGGPPSEGYLGFVSPGDGVYGFQRLDGNNLTSDSSMSLASTTHYDHVVATYDGNVMTLYVNGVAESTQPSAFSIAGATHHFVVGAEVGGAEDFFAGVLDEVAVYEHALSANRVSAHYLVGTGQGP